MNQNEHSATVWIVDDDPSLLRMLQALVSTLDAQVKAFATAKDFLDAYLPTEKSCLICDLRMPDIDGVELQRRLKANRAPLPIIFLTGFAEVSVAVEAMRDGALDFLQKPFSAHALLGKIQSALELGELQYEQWQQAQSKQARIDLLTPKERAIARLVVDAKSSREISQFLDLSVRTIENHRIRIMENLHVDSTIDLVKLFL